jgi:hypothetical protein
MVRKIAPTLLHGGLVAWVKEYLFLMPIQSPCLGVSTVSEIMQSSGYMLVVDI